MATQPPEDSDLTANQDGLTVLEAAATAPARAAGAGDTAADGSDAGPAEPAYGFRLARHPRALLGLA
jgi:hypothetical protein